MSDGGITYTWYDEASKLPDNILEKLKPRTDSPALLEDIRLQKLSLEAKNRKPAIVKMHGETWSAIGEYMQKFLVEGSTGANQLYGLRVVIDPCMKIGTARVFMEW